VPLSKTVIQTTSEAFEDEKEMSLGLLEKFIRELNELDRALMILYMEERSQNEIAEILGISVSNVATKIGRIKERLKKQFLRLNDN
jgi:RNA polymerase sigma-70 factor (ECF subfamily)